MMSGVSQPVGNLMKHVKNAILSISITISIFLNPDTMKKKNLKTTIGGIITAIGAGLIGNPSPKLSVIGNILAGIGALLIGAFAADASNQN